MKHTTERVHQEKARQALARLDKYGLPPVNVFTRLRLSAGPNGTALSHDALARQCLVTKQALIRLEQGTFTTPLPNVVDFYVARGESELRMRDAYEEFQDKMRERHYKILGEDLHVDLDSDTHVLRQLRLRCDPIINPTELAKALCIPQATVEHFEKKWKTQKSVPKVLVEVLQQIGYTWKEVEEFRVAYTVWRVRQNGENVTRVRFS